MYKCVCAFAMLFQTFSHKATALFILLASALCPYNYLLCWMSPTPSSKHLFTYLPHPLLLFTSCYCHPPHPHVAPLLSLNWRLSSELERKFLDALRDAGGNHTRVIPFPGWWLWNINYPSLKPQTVDLSTPLKMLYRTWPWLKPTLTSNISVVTLRASLGGGNERQKKQHVHYLPRVYSTIIIHLYHVCLHFYIVPCGFVIHSHILKLKFM